MAENSGSQTFLHVDPQLKYTIFCKPRALAQQLLMQGITTAELRHMPYNIVCDVTNKTVFIMSSQWTIFESNVLLN